jgi:radical SAM-linked protein
VLRDLDSVPVAETHVVPNLKVVHGRPSLEVMRGCVKGCRFCQAGYIYRPLRERDPQRVLASAAAAVEATGTQELSLLSLSTGDYSCVNPVITELMNRYSPERVAVSLPSTRVDALAPSLLEQIKRVRKTGFTLAPEAGTQRLRDIIQKEYGEDELVEAARQIFALGWRALKLYFMIGLPGETEDDLRGIAELAARVAAEGGRGVDVTASVSTFVPKPHTPFQWSAQISVAETEARQTYLRQELAKRRIRFKWHDARVSYLEGVVSRGGREIGALLQRAYELGCRFDGWTERCRFDLWERAMSDTGIDGSQLLRRRFLDETLPWDHIDSGVTKKFLQRELAYAVEGKLTPDCSIDRCTYCGACDFKEIRNVTYHLRGAKGGEHRGEVVDHWASALVDGGADGDGAWEPRGWHKLHTESLAAPVGEQAERDAGGGSATGPRRRAPSGASAKRGLGNAEEWLSASSEALTSAPGPAVAPRMRVRLDYSKTGRARFISHLEMIEVISGALRRARIPVAFSGGFHPQPRLRFSPGLPVGAESDCEVVDVDLTERLDPGEVAAALSVQLPEGLRISGAREVSLRQTSPDRELSGFRYHIDIATLDSSPAAIDAALADFAGAASFPMSRRTKRGQKQVDAREFVRRLERSGETALEIDVRFDQRGSLKPSEVVAAVLSIDPAAARALPLRKVAVFPLESEPPSR